MTFERSTDWTLIKEIVTSPWIYDGISDDGSPPRDQWNPQEYPDVWFIVVKEEDKVLGLWALRPQTSACWEVHTCLLPKAYGEKAYKAVLEFEEWVWKNTSAHRVVTDVPVYNQLALRFSLRAGLKQFGLNPKSYMKNGKLYDVIMLGISRPGVEPCR